MPEETKTINTPVSQEDLARMAQFQMARVRIADQMLELEEEKLRLLRAAASVRAEQAKLFEGILVDRGLSPNFPVEIDAKTGLIKPAEEEPTTPEVQFVPPSVDSSPVA